MTVYVVIWQDRHSDTGVYVFLDKDQAIEWAKQQARESDRFGDLNEELTEPMRKGDWLYYGCYSCEGDHLRVEACEVDAELGKGERTDG